MPRDIRICFVGDSFVNGTGDDELLGWTGRLCRSARARGVALTRYDLGVRRDTSAMILDRCAREVTARLDLVPCDGWVVFSLGANDATIENGARRATVEDTLANTSALLDWSRERYPTLMVGPPPVASDAAHDTRVAELSDRLEALCGSLSVPFLAVHASLSRAGVWRADALAGDGIHPNAAGYARLAALVEDWTAWRDWLDAGSSSP